MYIKKIIENDAIYVAIPLTATSGKTRIKQRDVLNAYGIPIATRQKPLTASCYVEWQIGYDVIVADANKVELTTLRNICFVGANGKTKALYELSEYIYYLTKWGIVRSNDLSKLSDELSALSINDLFDIHPDLSIKRSHFVEKEFNGIPFLSTRVEYPLIVHKFGDYEIVAEIITKEKQRAVGVQPMLYLCFPITELKTDALLIGRTAKSKEYAEFIINKANASVFVQLIRLFGMLSENHRKDVLSIIDCILKYS